jgi:hypothetical protein
MNHDFIGNENIFEVIGNQPVLDQYDVLYSLMQSGSMYDDYITGSLFTRTRILDVTTVTFGERGVAFSKLGVDKNALPSSSDKSLSYASQPWRERSGVVRFVKHLSDSERYYDTLLPRFDQIASKNGKSIINPTSGSLLLYYLGNPLAYTTVDGTWLHAFPFESRYTGIERVKRLSSTFIANQDESGSPISPPVKNSRIAVGYVGPGGGGIIFFDVTGTSLIAEGLFEPDASKALYGFGDLFDNSDSTLKNIPAYRYSVDPGFVTSPIVRGWKYGIYDGMPRYSGAIFRRDKFGQLRDMLEQRQFAKYIDDIQNAPFRRYDYPNETPAFTPNLPPTQGNTIPESPVSVSFVEPQIIDNKLVYTTIAALDSQASNLSLSCTSSLPYFDGLARNR